MTTEFIKQPGFLGAAFRLRRVPPGQDRSSGARVLWRRPAPATWTAWPMAFFEPTGTTCVSLGSLRCRARFVTPSASRLVVIVRTAQGRPESAGERLRRLHEDIDGGLDAGLDAAGYLGQGDRGRPDRVDQPSAAVDGRPHGAAGRPARGGGAGSTRGIRRSRPMTTRRRRRLRLTDAPRNTPGGRPRGVPVTSRTLSPGTGRRSGPANPPHPATSNSTSGRSSWAGDAG